MEIKVRFLGDFCIKSVKNLQFEKNLTQSFQGADLNIANLEAPVKIVGAKGIGKIGPCLSHEEDVPAFLEEHGFNVITLANNHTMDYGAESLLHTKSFFKSSVVVGAGDWREAYQVKTANVDGKKIGFLGLTHCEFGVLNDEFDKNQSVGTAWMLHPCVDKTIVEAKKEVDYLFILPHAGVEHEAYPLPELRRLYRHFIEMGADGVFASHPHIPQGWEYHQEKPIFYSLGNFCLDPVEKKERPFLKYGMMVSLTISDDKGMDVDVYYTKYDHVNKTVELTTDDFIVKHIEKVNQVMQDDGQYLAEVDAYCERILQEHWISFARSGYHTYDTKRFVGQIVRNLIGRQEKPDPNYLLNIIQCESHRWAILRALKNRKK